MKDKQAPIHGIMWLSIGKGASFVVTFGCGAALARLLMPQDFGVVALASAVFLPLTRLGAVGIPQEIVRLDESCGDFRQQVGAYALLNLFLVSAIALLALAVSVLPGLFSDARSRHVFLLIVLSRSVFNLFAPSRALLAKAMRFKAISLLTWAETALGAIGAVVYALSGGGVWSLVVPQMCILWLTGFAAYALAPWIPELSRVPAALTHLKGKALWYLSVGLAEEGVQRTNDIAVGKLFGTQVLGFYRRSFNLAGLFHIVGGTILTRVLFPFFAENADKGKINAYAYRTVISCVSIVLTPAVCLVAFHANGLIGFVYGEKWLPCVPLFQIMSVYAILQPLFQLTRGLLTASGGIKESAKAYGAILLVLAITLPIGLYYLGANGAAAAVDIALLAGLFRAALSARRLTGVSVFRCAWRAWAFCGATMLVLCAVWPALPNFPLWMELMVGTMLWGALSCAMLWSFERASVLHVFATIRPGKH